MNEVTDGINTVKLRSKRQCENLKKIIYNTYFKLKREDIALGETYVSLLASRIGVSFVELDKVLKENKLALVVSE